MSPAGRGIVLRQIDRLFGDGTLTGLGDGPLLERYLARRDEAAFEALVDLHGPMVLGLCRRMLRDPGDIEDAFQATFLVLARKAPAIRDRERLSSWLYGVAFRVARRARSRTLRRRDREIAVGVPEVAAEPDAERFEIGPMLDQELSRLPERYREPLVLCYLRGRTHEQAAADLRCPVGTVRSRLARGRDLLRDRLTRRGFAPGAIGTALADAPGRSAQLLVATVPTPLAAATARAAVGFGAPSIVQAGAAAATSAALARGVLTTMKFAQLKWFGMFTMAAALSAGGVVSLGYASATGQDAAGEVPKGAVAVDYDRDGRPDLFVIPGRGQKAVEGPGPTSMADARLKSLEEKIDALLGRSIPAPPFDTRFAPSQAGDDPLSPAASKKGQSPARPAREPANTPTPPAETIDPNLAAANRSLRAAAQGQPATNVSIQELEERLKLAILEYNYNDSLHKQNVISANQMGLVRAKVRIIAAQVESLDEETRDELDRLKLERRRKAAHFAKAGAEEEIAVALVHRNQVLNRRRPGMVAEEEVAKADGQLKVAGAQKAIAEVEVTEVDLRIQQLSRRRDRIKEVIELAKPVK